MKIDINFMIDQLNDSVNDITSDVLDHVDHEDFMEIANAYEVFKKTLRKKVEIWNKINEINVE